MRKGQKDIQLPSYNELLSLLIPFTESVDVINDIRGMVHNNVSLIAKIETESGMNNIEEIDRKAEGILIGRGDLALYSNLKDLFPNLRDAIEKVRENKIIFCTGILQNFSDTYMPERAEIFDLMLIKQLYANELILSGSSDFNFSNIRELYLHSLKSIKRKRLRINSNWILDYCQETMIKIEKEISEDKCKVYS